MATEGCSEPVVRRELEQLLSSAAFSRNERQSRFIRFVVEKHLEGKDDELKESVIAVEVFARKPVHGELQILEHFLDFMVSPCG